MKRYQSTALYHERKARRAWALAKNNPNEGYQFERARDHYRRAAVCRAKAAAISTELENGRN